METLLLLIATPALLFAFWWIVKRYCCDRRLERQSKRIRRLTFELPR